MKKKNLSPQPHILLKEKWHHCPIQVFGKISLKSSHLMTYTKSPDGGSKIWANKLHHFTKRLTPSGRTASFPGCDALTC